MAAGTATKKKSAVADAMPAPAGSTAAPFSLNSIHQCDFFDAAARMPMHCVDLVIADPPYNASKGGNWQWDNSVDLPGFGGNWSKIMEGWDDHSLADYFRFTLAWLSSVQRVLRPGGSLWVHGTYHNSGIINFAMQALGIEIINEVIWYKRNSFPNLAGRRLTASHETILWAHTGKKREYYFAYEDSKTMPCPGDQLKSPGKQMRTVWDIPNNKDRSELRFGKHPAQKPLRLLRRMISLSTREGDICLSPFAGAGSDCVAAALENRRFIGFEIEQEYIDIARRRIADASSQSLFDSAQTQQPDSGPPAVTVRRKKTTESAVPKSIPSLIKWTGSKRSQARAIFGLFPDHDRYIEPFLGGGALLYLGCSRPALAGDIYAPLMRLWEAVRDDPEAVTSHYRRNWGLLQDNLPDHYYRIRDRFNRSSDPLDLLFLLRTCVNGIVRFNEAGEFNNSFHLSRPGMHPDRFQNVVANWSARIQSVRFVSGSYETTLHDAGAGDFVYLDPPYAGTRQRYAAPIDIQSFFSLLDDLNGRGVKWALSFDGRRGQRDLTHPVPPALYKKHLLLPSGNSPVAKVLNGPIEAVHESLYLNY